MRKALALLLIATLLPDAHAAQYITGGVGAGGATVNGAGVPVSSSTIDAGSYGAKCDGTTDDAAAINSALAVARARATLGGGTASYMVGKLGRITLPSPGTPCLIKSTINLTGFYGAGLVLDFWGSSILCETNGTPCIDATGLGKGSINGLNIVGGSTLTPSIGLVLGRITNNAVGADHNFINKPTLTGNYTLTPFFNNQSETTVVIGATFVNATANAYGAIWDGQNYFNVQSALTGQTFPQNTHISFNENTCIECYIGVSGANSIPMWIGYSARMKFVNTYAYYSSSTASAPEPGAVLDFSNGGAIDFLGLDVHFEDFSGNKNLNSLVQFRGASAVTMHGLYMQDSYPEETGPIFSRGSGVSTVNLQDVDLHIGVQPFTTGFWDSAAAYTVSGRIYDQDNTYTAPGTFTGTSCTAASACNNSIILPSTLQASSIANSGGVSSIAPPLSATNFVLSNGASPTVTIGAPQVSGGQQAAASIAQYTMNGFGNFVGGVGCSAADQYVFTGGTPTGVAMTFLGNTVTSGVPQSSGIAYGSGSNYTALPPAGNTVLVAGTPNHCTTLPTLTGTVWKVASFTISSAGSGYNTAPAVAISGATTTQNNSIVVGLSSSFTASAGNGQLNLNASGASLTNSGGTALVSANAIGASLGSSGTSGFPTILAGEVEDGTLTSSTPATGATVTAAANTNSYGVLGGTTLASLTVVVPLVQGRIGQTFELTLQPAVTALTVQQTNGVVLASAITTPAITTLRFKTFSTTAFTRVQ